jgi:hypothetical protein
MSVATARRAATHARKAIKTPATKASHEAAPGQPAPGIAPVLPEHFVEIPPNAYKTLSAIREMGYGSIESVLDLVDNSIDAGATRIAVQVRKIDKTDADSGIIIDVLDNGSGMDEATLSQALRLGSDTERSEGDLGKYGMGLVTASLSMAQTIYVLTRKAGAKAFEANFDMAAIKQHNKFLVTLRGATDNAKVVEFIPDHGTFVRLSAIDRINDTNVQRFAAKLRTAMAQVYRNFMRGPHKVKFVVNRQAVQAADPLMRDHPATRTLVDTDLSVGNVKFHLTAVELPDLGQVGDEEAGISPHNSGFYVTRNGRQILGGETFGFYRTHHAYSHFRAEVAFGGDADHLFHVDIKKSAIHPDDALLARLKEATDKAIAEVGRSGRERPAESAAKLKLDHGTEFIQQRLALLDNKPAEPKGNGNGKGGDTDPAPRVKLKAADHKAAAEREATNGAAEPAKGGKAEAAPAAPTHEPRVRFTEMDAGVSPAILVDWVEKDGQWLIRINPAHPFSRMVADARHKFANSMLTMIAFALAQTGHDRKNGAEFVAAVGDKLATLLGVPAEA